MTQALFFILNNMLAISAAYRWASLMPFNQSPLGFVIIFSSNIVLIIYIAVLCAGIIGRLTPHTAALLALVILSMTFLFRKRSSGVYFGSLVYKSFIQATTLRHAVLILSVSGVCTLWGIKTLLHGTIFSTDDFTYHAVLPMQWLINESISFVPFTYQSYYPFNAELISLWFMLPYGDDTYASIPNLYWAVLIAMSIVIIVRRFDRPMEICLLWACILMSSPSLIRFVNFSGCDLAGPGSIIAACAFVLTSLQTNSIKRYNCYGAALYCGLLVGFAAGVKVTFIAVVPVFVFWLGIYLRKKITLSSLLLCLVSFIIGVFLTGSYWYARNIFLTGNPFFPAEIWLFKGPLTVDEQNRTKLLTWLFQSPLITCLKIIKIHFDWPWLLGLLSLSGYCGFLFVIKKRDFMTAEQKKYLYLLVSIGLVLALVYPCMPFSGAISHSFLTSEHQFHRVTIRFVIVPFIIGIVLLAVIVKSDKKLTLSLVTILVFLLCYYPYSLSKELLLAVMVVIYLLSITGFINYFKKILNHTFSSYCLVALFLLILCCYYPVKKNRTDTNFYSYLGTAAPSFKKLESLPPQSIIAIFSPTLYELTQYYAFFGRSAKLTPVRFAHDGTILEPLHVRYTKSNFSLGTPCLKVPTNITEQSLMKNLKKSGADYVLVTRWDTDKGTICDWPLQKELLENMSGKEMLSCVYQDDYLSIWKIR